MSLFGALSVGTSGIQAQSNALSVISDNISNSNTTGYKEGLSSFAALVSSYPSGGYDKTDGSANTNVTNGTYDPSGVLSSTVSLNNVQGAITAGTASTDIAISGSGFLPVSQNPASGGAILYTRAGSFTPDANGNLVNSSGFYLQGFPVDANGNVAGAVSGASITAGAAVANLQTVNIANLSETPIPTTNISLQANLTASQTPYSGTPAYNAASSSANMASGAVQPQFDTPITVVDSTGASHTLEAGFLKTSTNSWAMEVYAQPASDVTGANGGQVTAGTVTFNGDGSLASVSPALTQPLAISWQNGATNTVSLNLGTAGQQFGTPGATVIGRTDGLSQTAADYQLQDVQQNGVQAGTLTGTSVTPDGYITGSYSNGTTRDLYKVPLADFASPDQLQSQTGNVFTQTADSGPPDFLQAGQSGAGTMEGGSLESSNVDIETQLTSLVVAQNAYQFNSQLVSAANTLLQNLTSMDQTISV